MKTNTNKILSFLFLIFTLSICNAQVYFEHDFQVQTFPDNSIFYDLDQTEDLLFLEGSWFLRFIGGNPEKTGAWSSGFDRELQETEIDNWFIIPELDIQEATVLSFLFRKVHNDPTQVETLKIYISEDGLEPEGFTLIKTMKTPNTSSYCDQYVSLKDFSNKKINLAFVHQAESAGSIYIDNIILEANVAPQHDLETFVALPENPYVYPGQHEIHLGVNKLSDYPIASFDLNYKINGSNTMTTKAFPCPYFNENIGRYVVPDFLDLSEPGVYDIEFWTSNPDGEDDINTDNNYESFQIVVLEESAKRKVYLEEFTGTWCRWCTIGPVLLDEIQEEYGEDNFVITAIHGMDEFEIPEYNEILNAIPNLTTGFPTMAINRYQPIVNINPIAVPSPFWKELSSKALHYPTPANLSADISFEASKGKLQINAKASFIGEDAGDIRFHCLITEDGITGHPQSNIYNDSINYPTLYQAGDPILDYTHNHILRDYLSEPLGDKNIVSSTVNAGDVFEHEFTYEVPDYFIPENLNIVFFLSKNPNETNNLGQYIINVESFDLQEYLVGTNELNINENHIELFPNPCNDQITLNFASSRLPSTIQIVDNLGRVVLEKEILQSTATLNLTTLSKGVYFIKAEIDGRYISKKLIKL